MMSSFPDITKELDPVSLDIVTSSFDKSQRAYHDYTVKVLRQATMPPVENKTIFPR